MLNSLIVESNSGFNQSVWFPYYIFDIEKKININSLTIEGIIPVKVKKLLIYISEDGKNFSLIKIVEDLNYSLNCYEFFLDKTYTNVRYIKLMASSYSFSIYQ